MTFSINKTRHIRFRIRFCGGHTTNTDTAALRLEKLSNFFLAGKYKRFIQPGVSSLLGSFDVDLLPPVSPRVRYIYCTLNNTLQPHFRGCLRKPSFTHGACAHILNQVERTTLCVFHISSFWALFGITTEKFANTPAPSTPRIVVNCCDVNEVL